MRVFDQTSQKGAAASTRNENDIGRSDAILIPVEGLFACLSGCLAIQKQREVRIFSPNRRVTCSLEPRVSSLIMNRLNQVFQFHAHSSVKRDVLTMFVHVWTAGRVLLHLGAEL